LGILQSVIDKIKSRLNLSLIVLLIPRICVATGFSTDRTSATLAQFAKRTAKTQREEIFLSQSDLANLFFIALDVRASL
jgi:hypothetical protein